MDFREAWGRVGALEGETFRLESGAEFRYRFKRTYIVVEPGAVSVPRTSFEKVFKKQSDGDVRVSSVQGERYIAAVYADPRFVNFQS